MNDVIGSGLLANSFMKAKDINSCILCSGVSDSHETRESEFLREKRLLLSSIFDNKEKLIIYFSSVQVNESHTPYLKHKLNMEAVVKNNSKNYLIARLPQVVGVTSNSTIFPTFIRNVYLQKEIPIYKYATRSLVDVDDVMRIIVYLVSNGIRNKVFDLSPSVNISPLSIVTEIGKVLKLQPIVKIIEKGDEQRADVEFLRQVLTNKDFIFDSDYIFKIIQKYSHVVLKKIISESI